MGVGRRRDRAVSAAIPHDAMSPVTHARVTHRAGPDEPPARRLPGATSTTRTRFVLLAGSAPVFARAPAVTAAARTTTVARTHMTRA